MTFNKQVAKLAILKVYGEWLIVLVISWREQVNFQWEDDGSALY